MMMTSYPRKTGGFISGIVGRGLPVRLTLKYGIFTFFILVSICFPHDEQLPGKMRTSSLETSSLTGTSVVLVVSRASSCGAAIPRSIFCRLVRLYVFTVHWGSAVVALNLVDDFSPGATLSVL